MLSTNELTLIVILALTFALILSNRLPVELVAIGVLLVLVYSGLVSPKDALQGFSSSVVLVLIGLFVITSALDETGVTRAIANYLNRIGGGSETRMITLFMVAGATVSLTSNTVAAGAVLLPAAVRVAQISGVRASKLLIPLSFGTLVGGMATYLTTANIVISGLLQSRGFAGLGMADFIPTGSLIVLAGLAYMLLIGRHLLPERESIISVTVRANLQQTYQLDERMWEVSIRPGSRLDGIALRESNIGETLGLAVLAVWHGRQAIFAPEPEQMLHAEDYLLVLGRKERVDTLLEWGTDLRNGTHHPNSHDLSVDLVEVLIPPRSDAVGQTLQALDFRSRFGLTAVALWREGRSYRTDVGTRPLQVGDALLVVGRPQRVKKLAAHRDYVVPAQGYSAQPARPEKAWLAVLITAVVLLIAVLNALPLPELMLTGAVAMVLSGCLNMDGFYKAIEWRVIFLIAGMLPLSIAMNDTGLAARLGSGLVGALAESSPLVLVGAMFLLAAGITQVIGGQVTALVVGPIAITAALQMGISPQAMAVAVAIGCSTAFLTPISHPVNVLMMGPGGYTFGDFFKVGIGMTVVTLLTLLLGMTIIWRV